jgi:threonine/homoserine/homoserine lactone efflux protein
MNYACGMSIGNVGILMIWVAVAFVVIAAADWLSMEYGILGPLFALACIAAIICAIMFGKRRESKSD